MGKITYKPSYTGLRALMNGPEMQAMLRQVAEKGVPFAQSVSPARTGEYRGSFRVETRANGGVHGDRAEAKIINDSPHAARVEWQDGYHVLNRTAAALGSL